MSYTCVHQTHESSGRLSEPGRCSQRTDTWVIDSRLCCSVHSPSELRSQLISRQFDHAGGTSDADRVGKLPHGRASPRLLCNSADYDRTGPEESAARFPTLMYRKAAGKCQRHLPAVKSVLF